MEAIRMALEADKGISIIVDKNGERYCKVQRAYSFFDYSLAIREPQWQEIGKLMKWKQKKEVK